MGTTTKRRIAGLAITGLVIAGVVGVTSMSASGATPAPAAGPVITAYGTLTIQLNGSTGKYILDLAGPGGVSEEVIQTSNPCAALVANTGNWLRATPTTPADTVQIRNDAFGVNTGNTSCGSSSAAVISGNERLTINLGPALDGVFIKSANLKLTQVKRGNLKIGIGTGALGSPITISQSPQSVAVAPADLFRSITIATTSTRDNEGLSLANGTTFELVATDPDFDVAVNCNEFVPSPAPGEVATSATYLRLDNKASTTNPCEEVGVRVQIQDAGTGESEGRVFWNNQTQGVNGGSTQAVQAFFTIEWAATTDQSKFDRVIDYDGDGPGGATSMLWCGPEADGVPTLPTYTDAGSVGTGLAPWCLVEDNRDLQADGTIVQTQKLFGSGDPWAR